MRGSERVYFDADAKKRTLTVINGVNSEKVGDFSSSENGFLASAELRGTRVNLISNKLVLEDVNGSSCAITTDGTDFSCHLLLLFDGPRGISVFHSGSFGCEIFDIVDKNLVIRQRWV